jgi:hypothetical protein
MSEKELAKALLRLGQPKGPDAPNPKEQIQRILARDRTVVKLLTAFTLFLWLGSIVLLYYFIFELTGVYARIQQLGGAAPDPLVAPIYQFLIGLASSVEALILALLSTLILVYVTRRASLRHINASLFDITEKLSQLEEQFLKQ